MRFMYSIFFGAGVAAFAYTRIGRRVGYGNTKNVWTVISVIFVLCAAVFYTIMRFFLNIS